MKHEITVLIQFVTKPSEADLFAGHLRESALDRSRYPGTVRVSAHRDRNAPWRFTLLEVFDSQETIDAYYATPQHKQWARLTDPMLVDSSGEDQAVIVDWCSVRGLRVGSSAEATS